MFEENKKLTFVQHLDELRRRLTWVVVVNLMLAMVCFYFIEYLFDLIFALSTGMNLIYINPPELFMVYIKLSFIAAFVIASPFTLYHIWAYIRTGLTGKEKALVIFVMVFGFAFFLIGAVFSYMVVIPITLAFFLGMGIEGIAPMISVQEFVAFILSMMVAFGIVFEMPVIVAMLARVGFLREEILRKNRGVIILGIFILAALITPPDLASQVLLALPMMVLLEMSIYVCRFFQKKHAKSLEANQEAEQIAAG